RLPTEREANAAAGAYARRALAPAELDALRRVPELAGLLAAEPPADVVAETAALLRARLGEDGAAPAPAALAPPRRAEPLVEVVHPVEAPAQWPGRAPRPPRSRRSPSSPRAAAGRGTCRPPRPGGPSARRPSAGRPRS